VAGNLEDALTPGKKNETNPKNEIKLKKGRFWFEDG
jgi:hypothetical protein